MLVGLCGRSGSGKGYIAAMFADRGIPSVDTDAVYREMTEPSPILSPCMTALVAQFGKTIVTPDNALDRAVMRTLVFGTGEHTLPQTEREQNLAALNRITHQFILEKTERIAATYVQNGCDIVLIDAPLLYESGFDRHCAAVICVTAPEEVRLARIMKRDGIDRNSAEKRLATQLSAETLLNRADYVIENDADRETLYRRVDRVIADLRKSHLGETV